MLLYCKHYIILYTSDYNVCLPCNIEIPLSSEQSHLHLHLGIQVTHAHSPSKLLLTRVLLHLPDGVKEEEYEDGHQDIEVVHHLGLQTSHNTASEYLVPHPQQKLQ